MYKLISTILFTFSLVGCVTYPEYSAPNYSTDVNDMLQKMYNVPSSGTSQFDNSKHIRMSNMVCSNAVMFELYQDTPKAKKGTVLLKAGSKSITNIAKGKSLLIKLDGKTYSFSSTDALTEHETIPVGYGVNMQFSHKTYVLPESFVREIASSNTFLTKMYLLNNSYIEGKCSELTLAEAKEQNKKLGYDLNITQDNLNSSNSVAAIKGFRDFIKMTDSTKW